jgi:predicted alpha/beta-fold hydrolase
LGANNLTLLLGQPDLPFKIDAAVCFQGPMILVEVFYTVLNSLFGICNTGMGKNMLKKLKKHLHNKEIIA